MRPNSLFLSVFLAITTVSAAALPSPLLSPPSIQCGTQMPASDSLVDAPLSRKLRPRQSNPQIHVYFHVMACDNTEDPGGYIPQYRIDPLFNHLRDTFYTYGIDMLYLGTDWHVHWATCSAKTEPAVNSAKSVHRNGTYKDLNIWIMDLYGNFGRGIATPPVVSPTPAQVALDGVVIHKGVLPGDPAPYDQGDTLIHEVGHWLNLYHTFEGGCDTSTGGDFVSDTPYHQVPAPGTCPPSGTNTCPSLPGNDPNNNFMNYVSDACASVFTPGQVTRMLDAWYTLRDGL